MDRNGTYLGGWPGRTVIQGKDRTLLASPDTYLFFFSEKICTQTQREAHLMLQAAEE